MRRDGDVVSLYVSLPCVVKLVCLCGVFLSLSCCVLCVASRLCFHGEVKCVYVVCLCLYFAVLFCFLSFVFPCVVL